jgi:hypothetical protein
MKTSRRGFLKKSVTGIAGLTIASSTFVTAATSGNSSSLLKKDTGLPDPATFDRLPLSWYKKQLGRLKDKMKEKELDAIWLRDPLNIVYFTGFF